MKAHPSNEVLQKIFSAYSGAGVRHPCDLATFEYRGIRYLLETPDKPKPILFGDWSGGTNPELSAESWCEWNEISLSLTPLGAIQPLDAADVAKIVLASHNRHYKPEDLFYEITLRNDVATEVTLFHQSQQLPKPTPIGLLTVRIERDAVVTAACDSDVFRRGDVYHTPMQYMATDFLRSSEWNGRKKPAYNIGWGPYTAEDLVEMGIAKY